jgi:hypothetical protein
MPKEGRRRVVLLAGDGEGLEARLRRAGNDARSIAFTPFDREAAAKVRHFETYNRTEAGQRVADIVSALRAEPGAALVAAGREALASILAAAIEPPRLAVLDVSGIDTGEDDVFLESLYVPGLRRAGDLETASEMAGDRLVIHGAGPRLTLKGGRVQRQKLSDEEIVRLLTSAR